MQYFLDEKRNQTSRKQKVSTRVNQKGMSRKRALDFEHESHFPKTISQLEFDYALFKKLLRIIIAQDFLLSL